jgi:hypothetical protein
MNYATARFIGILSAVFLTVASALAVDVRGRLLLRPPQPNMQPYPASGFQVALAIATPQGLMAVGLPSFTGPDGMYMLVNVEPGQYYLTVVAPNNFNWRIPVIIFKGTLFPSPTGPRWVFDVSPLLL